MFIHDTKLRVRIYIIVHCLAHLRSHVVGSILCYDSLLLLLVKKRLASPTETFCNKGPSIKYITLLF